MTKVTFNIPGYPYPVVVSQENTATKSIESESILICVGTIVTTLIALGCYALKNAIVLKKMKPYIEKLGGVLKERYQEYIIAYNYLKKKGIIEKLRQEHEKDMEGFEEFPPSKEDEFIKGAITKVMKYYVKDKNSRDSDSLDFWNQYARFYSFDDGSGDVDKVFCYLEKLSSNGLKNTAFKGYIGDTFSTVYIISKLNIPQDALNELMKLR
jgi:hypothetical protein